MPDITNNFKVWAEDLETNPNAIPNVSDFVSDNSSDRKDGFKPNTAASSQWANAGLRQANLFVASFMEAMKESGIDISNLNLASTVNALKTALESYHKIYLHRIRFGLNHDNYIIIQIYTSSEDKITDGTPNSLNTWLRQRDYVYNTECFPCSSARFAPGVGTNMYEAFGITYGGSGIEIHSHSLDSSSIGEYNFIYNSTNFPGYGTTVYEDVFAL